MDRILEDVTALAAGAFGPVATIIAAAGAAAAAVLALALLLHVMDGRRR